MKSPGGPVTGFIIGSYGILDAVVFPSVLLWLYGGERNVSIADMTTFIPISLTFPVINFLARGWGQSSWILLLTLMDAAYG